MAAGELVADRGGQVFGDELAHLGAERDLLGAEAQIHVVLPCRA